MDHIRQIVNRLIFDSKVRTNGHSRPADAANNPPSFRSPNKQPIHKVPESSITEAGKLRNERASFSCFLKPAQISVLFLTLFRFCGMACVRVHPSARVRPWVCTSPRRPRTPAHAQVEEMTLAPGKRSLFTDPGPFYRSSPQDISHFDTFTSHPVSSTACGFKQPIHTAEASFSFA